MLAELVNYSNQQDYLWQPRFGCFGNSGKNDLPPPTSASDANRLNSHPTFASIYGTIVGNRWYSFPMTCYGLPLHNDRFFLFCVWIFPTSTGQLLVVGDIYSPRLVVVNRCLMIVWKSTGFDIDPITVIYADDYYGYVRNRSICNHCDTQQ